MLSINPTHSKIKELLHPYLDEETRMRKVKECCSNLDHNNQQSLLMDERLNDFGCKYRITIKTDSQSPSTATTATTNSDITVSTYVSIIGWDEVKDSAIVALKAIFGEANIKGGVTNTFGGEIEESSHYEDTSGDNVSMLMGSYNVMIEVRSNKHLLDQGHSLASTFESLCQLRFIILGSRLKSAFCQLKQEDHPTSQHHLDDPKQEHTFKIPIQRLHRRSSTSQELLPTMMYVTTVVKERVTIVIPIIFQYETDRALAKLFVQQFRQAQQQSSARNVPVCDFRRPNEPPREIVKFLPSYLSSYKESPGTSSSTNSNLAGYLTLTFFNRHFQHNTNNKEQKAVKSEGSQNDGEGRVVETVLTIYDFLDYHIKCCKSYVHTRLREKKNVMMTRMNSLSQKPC